MLTSLLFSLKQASYDSLLEVLLFLEAEECGRLGRASKDLYAVAKDEKLWRKVCISRISGFNHEQTLIDTTMQLVGTPDYLNFYVAFRNLQRPLMGWYRKIPTRPSYKGGLYCVSRTEHRLIIMAINHDGTIEKHKVYYLLYNFSLKSMQTMNIASIGQGRLVSLGVDNTIELLGASNEFSKVLKPMPHRIQISSICPAAGEITALVQGCLGLFTAPYGSHGTEILHLSVHTQSMPSAIQNSELDFGLLQLHGLKITGDPNVPASQLSFCVNLLSLLDIHDALQQDQRPVVMFPSLLQPPAVISLLDRSAHMLLWARGYGQINRDPRVWSPEWVGCGFILYKTSLPDSLARFTIVWDDESDMFRHGMDFKALSMASEGILIPELS
ncbi:DUF3506 domain-containing protein [archaeon]|nr:MAG: DUF3506 domain-containing protein [archaeon]